jgi:hypothetical protein
MSEITANLKMPYILPSQAQKHVTHNEALQLIDAVVQLRIEDTLDEEPEAPEEGECYLVGDSPTGAWAGKADRLAFRQDGAWIFIEPLEGWRAWFRADGRQRYCTGAGWSELPLPDEASFVRLGVNATADASNRLAISSPASLFNNAGNGHQIKVNKAASGDTASLLFQTGWSGRAEMGLAGNDEFSVKVSPDGASWATGFSIAPGGIVRLPNRPLARAALSPQTATPADGEETGFDTLHVSQGGMSLGATLASGYGKSMVVPASGFYLVALSARIVSTTGHMLVLTANGSTGLVAVNDFATVADGFSQHASAITYLSAGDTLTLKHFGTATYEFDVTKTEAMVLML